MKRTALAFLLLSCGALARAEESAYVSLVGMAETAANDRGPEAGEIPSDLPRRSEARPASRQLKSEQSLLVFGASARPASVRTRLFASLTPSTRVPSLSSFEVGVSTSVRVQAASVPVTVWVEVSSAAHVGKIRGLAEYLAVAAAPTAILPTGVR
ncbi:MAG: hypothetical protein A2506_03025 [Elusimicrobia bacterium RIFOXYD12_FULL_66_9]|nr:MAG: hypothetical protein A2506_03025 [Elusimicrobia bacterium RIFOXYD12_FULL_66_9]